MDLLKLRKIILGNLSDVVTIQKELNPKQCCEMGTNSRTEQISEGKTLAGQERIERKGNDVKVYVTLVRSSIQKGIIERQKWQCHHHMTNLSGRWNTWFYSDNYNVHALSLQSSNCEILKQIWSVPSIPLQNLFSFTEMMGYLSSCYPQEVWKCTKTQNVATMSKEQLQKSWNMTKRLAVNKATDDVIQSVVKFQRKSFWEARCCKKPCNRCTWSVRQTLQKNSDAVKRSDREKSCLIENMICTWLKQRTLN